MPNADFFASIGFFTRRGFLDPETCARLRAEVRSAPVTPATVRAAESSYDVVRSSRSTAWADVSLESATRVERRLDELLPELERHYAVRLTGQQGLQFLVYREGDFFAAHRDRAEGDGAPAASLARRVAAVIFLNAEGDAEASEGYRGGALTFFGLFDQANAETLGFPVEPEEGLLVTFPTDVVHEVRPVEAGERYTIVTWFLGDGESASQSA